MGFFSPVTKPFKKVANKVMKPFQKVSDKLLPNELRPLLPYASMFLPASGILGQLGGAAGFAKMYAANMLTQAMADPEADFEDLNQLSGILSGAQGALSGTNTASNLRDSATFGSGAEQGPLTASQAQTLADRSLLTKASDLGKNISAVGSDYLTGNMDTLRDIGAGRMPLNLETAKAGAKALAPSFAQASGDVAVNYQRPAMREYERFANEEQAEFDRTNKATSENRANLQMTFMRQAGIPEAEVKETLDMNDLGEYYEPPTEEAAYGGLMGRSEYEFGGITEALKNSGARGLMDENQSMGGMMMADKVETKEFIYDAARDNFANDMFGKDYMDLTPEQVEEVDIIIEIELGKKQVAPERTMAAQGGIMNGYNMGGSVLPRGMEMDYRQGGFIPMGSKERADDVPARVSKNEFVMTADAVRAAGGGSVNQGAKKMYDLMNNLEAKA